MKFNSPRIIFNGWTERSLVSLYVFFAKYFNRHATTFSSGSSLPHSHFACLFCHHMYDPFFSLVITELNGLHLGSEEEDMQEQWKCPLPPLLAPGASWLQAL